MITDASNVSIAASAPRINNFSILVAAVNGTGSQTANHVLLRALFRMGIPVSGKNIFPSNIQGLATWFILRVSERGYGARCDQPEITIAMNKNSVEEDILNSAPGGMVLYEETLSIEPVRADLVYYPLPAFRLAMESGADPLLRSYLANMVYVGALAHLLEMEQHAIDASVHYYFQNKPNALDKNSSMIHSAMAWAAAHLIKTDPFRVERRELNQDYLLVDGNTASALGSIWGGVSFAAWYPITPASSLTEALQENLPALRAHPADGKPTFAVVQAEDEMAALGMAVGAGWMGARSMTATSGPGFSLMTEYIGLAYFAEVPVVVWDVQRMGPSTGLPTRVAQGDLLFASFMGHGDARHVVLLPNAEECFEFGWRAFDLAERLQTPVLVLSDLDIGVNLWRVPAFRYPDSPMDRGKVLNAEELNRVGEFARYRDVDGDGIGWRTLPGTPHPKAAYFARGTGHTDQAAYSERPEIWEQNMARLTRKYQTAQRMIPPPIQQIASDARHAVIAFGSCDEPVREALAILQTLNIPLSYLRVRALPFTEDVPCFLQAYERVYVVEMNAEGQLHLLLRMEYPQAAQRMRGLTCSNGLPLSAAWVAAEIRHREGRL
jgi:2-oxoglutarate/2-oxoacid ferredoxin oxidoreductase subunit alpha